jgi:hypothetical protein
VIVSTARKIIIATPTKTGTESLMQMLTIDGQFDYINPKHSIEYPMLDGWRRVLVVRDPYERLQSMYLFAIAHGGKKGLNFASKHCRNENGEWCSFSDFLKFHRKMIKHPTWGFNYSQICEVFKPNEIWKLDRLVHHLREFELPTWPHCDFCGEAQIIKANTRDSFYYWLKNKRPSSKFSKADLKLVRSFVEPDCIKFDYPLRGTLK